MFIVLKDGKIKMQTAHKDCLPDEDTQKQMKKLGYKFKEKTNENKMIDIK